MLDIPVKSPGDSFFANECTSMFSEEENIIEDTGITLSAGDLFQISKAVANYVASGDYYTDTGAADAYVINVLGSKKAPTVYAVGTRVRFEPANANTGASTINVASLGVKAIVKFDGTALVGGELLPNTEIILSYDGTSFRIVSNSHSSINNAVTKKFRDCILTNTITDLNKDIDFGAGYFRADNADIVFHLPQTVVKQVDVAWADGTATGGSSVLPLVADSWLHCFYIASPSGKINAGWDTDIAASNLMAAAAGDGYIYYARRTSIYIDASSNIDQFYNIGDDFLWNYAMAKYFITSIPASPTNVTIQTPADVVTEAYVLSSLVAPGGGGSGGAYSSNKMPLAANQFIETEASGSVNAAFTILADENSQVEHSYTGLSPSSYSFHAIGYKELYS